MGQQFLPIHKISLGSGSALLCVLCARLARKIAVIIDSGGAAERELLAGGDLDPFGRDTCKVVHHSCTAPSGKPHSKNCCREKCIWEGCPV